jgi:hypothetical protein
MTSAPFRFAIGPISATGLTVPDGVSECTTASSSVSGCAAKAASTISGSTCASYGTSTSTTVAPYSASQRPNHFP